MAGDVPNPMNTPTTSAADFMQTVPWSYGISAWTVVGNCYNCGAPFLAQLTSVTVPTVHRACACVAPKRRRRAKLAADGLPRVEPDTQTQPMFTTP